MVLHAEERQLPMLQTLHGLIVQIDVCDAQLRRSIDRVPSAPPHRESVILRSDLDRPVVQPPYRVVSRSMAVQELERGGAERTSHQLMTQADTKDRDVALPQLLDGLQCLPHCLGVSWAVGQEKAIRLLLDDGSCRRGGWQRGNAAAALGKQPLRVTLDAEIVGQDVE